MKSFSRIIQVLTISLTLFSQLAVAQVAENSELFKTIKAQDSLLFEVGFNQCNLPQMEKLLPEEVEFYHDKHGMMHTKTVFMNTMKENLCSTGTNSTQRVIEEGSLEVFPLHNEGELYGAILTGSHSFGSTIAKFTHLFLLKEGKWLLHRILSYDHKPKAPTKITGVQFIQLSSKEAALYIGDYEFSPDFTLSIVKEGDKLYGDAQGQKVEIKPYGNHSFVDESEMMRLTFITNDSGVVTGLTMKGPEGEMTAKKKE